MVLEQNQIRGLRIPWQHYQGHNIGFILNPVAPSSQLGGTGFGTKWSVLLGFEVKKIQSHAFVAEKCF
jgi:hypothetical protein